jgi:hypothetical protein
MAPVRLCMGAPTQSKGVTVRVKVPSSFTVALCTPRRKGIAELPLVTVSSSAPSTPAVLVVALRELQVVLPQALVKAVSVAPKPRGCSRMR